MDPIQVTFVALPGAPPAEGVLATLARDAFDLEVRDGATLLAGPAPDRPLVVCWLPAAASEPLLAAPILWRDRLAPPPIVLGVAPLGGDDDSERALAAGYDDFVAGRASPRELAARLRALTRRIQTSQPHARRRFGRLVLDAARHELSVDDRRIPLTVLEVTVLATLLEARGGALSRIELLDRVWGEDNLEIGLRAVDNLILRLRRKIGDPDAIVTVRGVGFRLADR